MSAHAASRRRQPPVPPSPAPPSPAARAPRAAPRRPWLLRVLTVAIALGCAGAVVALGSAIPQRGPATPWRPVALGPATLEVPVEWQPVAPSASGAQGLPEPAVAFATAPGLQAHAVLALAPAGDTSSAEAALERFLGPLGAPRRSRVAGRPARAYAARPVDGGRMAEATLVPTASGTLLVVCIAKSVSWVGAARCADGLLARSLRVVPWPA